jgi:prevent-host-death family protein
MSTVGLRELRQQASELVRRVEAGEEVTITVAGRPSARLVAAERRSWRQWDEHDRDRIDQQLRDPWTAR